MEALLANEKEYDRNKFLFVCLFVCLLGGGAMREKFLGEMNRNKPKEHLK